MTRYSPVREGACKAPGGSVQLRPASLNGLWPSWTGQPPPKRKVARSSRARPARVLTLWIPPTIKG